MNCKVCGTRVEEDEQLCSACNEIENKVQVLSLEEKQQFKGITLEQEGTKEEYYRYEKNNTNQKIYIKQFSVGQTSWLIKILIGITLAILVVVALPIFLVIMTVLGLFFYVLRR